MLVRNVTLWRLACEVDATARAHVNTFTHLLPSSNSVLIKVQPIDIRFTDGHTPVIALQHTQTPEHPKKRTEARLLTATPRVHVHTARLQLRS